MLDLIQELRNNNIDIYLEGENLKLSFDQEEINAELIEKIRDNKTAIVSFLKEYAASSEKQQIKPVAIAENYALSNAQLRLWLACQTAEESVTYNMPNQLVIDGEYDALNFEKAILKVIERHEILRTVFKVNEALDIRQYILNAVNFQLDVKDFSENTNAEEVANTYVQSDYYKPFNFSEGPLLRAGLYKLANRRYMVYYNMHHIISDNLSMGILLNDTMAFYQALQTQSEAVLPTLNIQYKDYAAWQIEQLVSSEYDAHKTYWTNKFNTQIPPLNLPSQKNRPLVKTYSGKAIKTYIAPAQINTLKAFATANKGSVFMGLLAAWKVLLYRYTGETDIAVGNIIAGRDHEDLENQIGFYINILILRNEIDPALNFTETFNTIKENTLQDYEHQMYPFDALVSELNIQRDRSRSPLADIHINYYKEDDQKSEGLSHNTITEEGTTFVKSDIELHFVEHGDYIELLVNYNEDVYEASMMKKLIQHYKNLLSNVLESPHGRIKTVSYLTKVEIEEQVNTFNNNIQAYEVDKTMLAIFSECVEKHSETTALVCEEAELSYRELDEKSNQFATILSEVKGIQKGDIIGVHLKRDEYCIIALLAILKIGAVYLPIDTTSPKERKEFIIKDANVKLLIVSEETTVFEETPSYIFGRDTALSEYSKIYTSNVHVEDIAYIIYTSGSTGQPKGALITHGGICNTIQAQIEAFDIKGNQYKCLQFASFSFDASISEIFLSLLSGGTLYVATETLRLDPIKLESYNVAYGIEVMTLPPSYFKMMNIESFNAVKVLITAGEAAAVLHAKAYVEAGGTFYNAYGPTETSICATVFKLDANNISKNNTNVPIGTPIANVQTYILDANHQLLPKGAIGEICVSGKGLAKGYLNRDALTEERFTTHSFIAGEKMYKTGDLGYYLSDGNIVFIGRKDDQVKIRGYRIELGEIEAVLKTVTGIQHAAVLLNENIGNTKQLVAYIVADASVNSQQVQNTLEKYLPAHMIPKIYVALDEMPINKNGKIDKKQLPEPQESALNTTEYVAPTTETEKTLFSIWEELLGISKIGIHDNFFELGGHSLLAVKLAFTLTKHYEMVIDRDMIFQFPTIDMQAKYLDIKIIDTINEDEIADDEVMYL